MHYVQLGFVSFSSIDNFVVYISPNFYPLVSGRVEWNMISNEFQCLMSDIVNLILICYVVHYARLSNTASSVIFSNNFWTSHVPTPVKSIIWFNSTVKNVQWRLCFVKLKYIYPRGMPIIVLLLRCLGSYGEFSVEFSNTWLAIFQKRRLSSLSS